MKALRLGGGHSTFFTCGPKGMIDLMTPLPTTFYDISWENLAGKTIKNNNIILAQYGDIHPFQNGPILECETLFLYKCDKNFLAYWLNRRTFPKANKVYINSHPCQSHTLITLDPDGNENEWKYISKFNEIYLHEHFYNHYKNKWWSDIDSIKNITDSDFEKKMASYDNEQIILKE
jgi:hypothetical protein